MVPVEMFHLPVNSAVVESPEVVSGIAFIWLESPENKLEIDESIFIDSNDKIQQSKQIVINGFVEDSIRVINWSIKEL